jgi:hypothetical protein
MMTIQEKQFMEYRVEAAEKFVTHAVVSEVKRDVMDGIKQMESRLETQINRLVPPPVSARPRVRNGG